MVTIYPGTYCGGIAINSQSVVTMSMGTYVLTNSGGQQGSFNVNGGATVSGTGVTIYLTSGDQETWGTFKINGNSTVTLSAQTSGETAGILFWVDKNAPSNGKNQVTGGATGSLTGAIYAPSEEVDYTGGSSTGTGCTQVVAWIVGFSGNSAFQHSCAGTGVSDPVSAGQVVLVQ